MDEIKEPLEPGTEQDRHTERETIETLKDTIQELVNKVNYVADREKKVAEQVRQMQSDARFHHNMYMLMIPALCLAVFTMSHLTNVSSVNV